MSTLSKVRKLSTTGGGTSKDTKEQMDTGYCIAGKATVTHFLIKLKFSRKKNTHTIYITKTYCSNNLFL